MSQIQATDRHWRWARWVLLALAIGLQSAQVCYIGNYHHGFFNSDKAIQVAAARGLLDGQGLTWPEVNPADASKPDRRPLMQWPMGYTVLFAVLWPVFGDLWNTALAIEVLGAVLFFTAWLAILEWLGAWVSVRVKALLLIYWALVWNVLNVQTCTEMLSISLLCWAVAFCLASVTGRRPMWSSAAAALCVGLAAWMRFAYWPLVVVPPASLAVAAWCGPNRRQLAVATLLNAALVGLLLGVVVALQRLCTGYTTALTGVRERELTCVCWSNLLWVCPFPSAVFGFNDIWPFITRHVKWLGAIPELKLDWAMSAAVLAALAAWGVWAIRRLGRMGAFRRAAGMSIDSYPASPAIVRPAEWTLLATFVAAAVFTTGVTIVMLAYLSIRTPLDPGDYTYVVERRYFAVFYPFWGLALAGAIVAFLKARGGWLVTAAKPVFLTLFVAWVAAGATWRVGSLVTHRCDTNGGQSARRADRAECRLVDQVVRRHLEAGRPAVFIHPRDVAWFCTHGERLEGILAVMCGCPHMSYDAAEQLRLPPGKSVVLLAVLPDDGTPNAAQAARFIANHGGFTHSINLRDGRLYECVWSADATARSDSACCVIR